MTLLAKKTGGAGSRDLGPLAPNGVHQAVCVDVIDLGEITDAFEGRTRTRHMTQFVWQLKATPTNSSTRYLVGKRYNLSLNEKATLRKDLESWFAKPMTREQELNGIDVEKVIGRNCMVNVQQVVKPTGTYANVIAIMPLFGNMTKIVANGYQRTSPPDEVEIEDHDDVDPFADHAASTAPVGAAAPPVAVTDDDIPF